MQTLFNPGSLFLISFIFFISYKESSSLKSMLIKVPEIVKSGDTVTLTCEYDLENVALYSLRWYWNDEEFYRFIPKESPPFKAFPVKFVNIDMSKSGEHAVTLRDINRQLTGNYKCEVSADLPFFHTSVLVAHMTVIELPQHDPIMFLLDNKVEVGKKVEAECFTNGSFPEANITWFINNKKVGSDSNFITVFPTKIELDPQSKLISSRSRIEIITRKSNFLQGDMSIKCHASIYDVWKKSVENYIKDDSPEAGQVVGTVLFHSQMVDDFTYGLGNNARWTWQIFSILILTLFFI